jgi:hypothetical protein
MNQEIESKVKELNNLDEFRIRLSQATGRMTTTISLNWLKRGAYKIPVRFQDRAMALAEMMVEEQQERINRIKVQL